MDHVVFRVGDGLFAVPASSVREVVLLPDLRPVAEAPLHVMGVFDLRGALVPVVDLDLRMGDPARPYRLEDAAVVVDHEGGPTGVVANEVLGVEPVPPEQVESRPEYVMGRAPLLAGFARAGGRLLTLIEPSRLRDLDAPPAQPDDLRELADARRALWAFDEPARATLRARAASLARRPDEEDARPGASIAVVALDGERFGLDLGPVREFASIRQLTPLPGVPPHVLGVMNLRGDLVTVVDLRVPLGLPAAPAPPSGAVVVRVDDGLAGLAVDAVVDVATLHEADVGPVPVAARALAGAHRMLGAVPHDGRLLTLLDLPGMLRDGDLVVHEEV